ncbi:DUF2029 domain-containing protein [Duganella sp. FT94W]|uniref:DUF2029 domain-containing protein n=1 Tax=Duganella lactea TaxID=2692173 RepID=A0ABW9VCI9_9BURK|nr:glycosyltransferase 87 family protein [Duganella lactea]MYM36691.1 DUF2029 domain-containing protein [Duganella lactea]
MNSRVAAILVPVLFGLVAIIFGQDDNWDLRNYHVYNVYALLNERIGHDLAPARFQTYFNPTIDLLYYGLNRVLPPWATGFVMGALHGLNFVLLLGIGRRLLGRSAGAHWPLWLALAGVLGPGFRGELGNTMGDNLTALLVLGGLYVMLSRWDALLAWGGRTLVAALVAGLLLGLGTGLKLTNALYAVALCLACLGVPLIWHRRIALAFVFGIGVLAGMALTGGWWFVKMWQLFGNPTFPQFNDIFHSPWTVESGVIDTYFRPKNWVEYLIWPFVFAQDWHRVTEVAHRLGMWAVVYVLFAAASVAAVLRRLRGGGRVTLDGRAVFFLLFFALAYLVWMRMFSIYRYLIALELLVPLAIWLLWHSIGVSEKAANRLAGVTLALLLVYAFPTPKWGNAAWGEHNFSAQVPAFSQPEQSVVFIAQPEPPMSWLVTLLPAQLKFIGIDMGFPESAAWRQRIRQAVAERKGPHYALLGAVKNEKQDSLQNKLDAAEWLGWTADASGCAKLEWLGRHIRLQADLRRLPSGGCTLELPQPYRNIDLATPNRAIADAAAAHLANNGLSLDVASCGAYPAAVGSRTYMYQLCRVTPTW